MRPRIDGKQTFISGKTQKDVLDELGKLKNDVKTGNYISSSDTTLAEWVENDVIPAWVESFKPSYVTSLDGALKRHVLPTLGGKKLQELKTGHFDRLFKTLAADGRSESSLKTVIVASKKMMDRAVKKSLILKNPVLDADTPKGKAPKKVRWWTAEEVASFLGRPETTGWGRCGPPSLPPAPGEGEVLALKWSDLEGSKLTVSRSRVSVDHEIVEGTPKTESGVREIGLDKGTLGALKRPEGPAGRGEAPVGGPWVQRRQLHLHR